MYEGRTPEKIHPANVKWMINSAELLGSHKQHTVKLSIQQSMSPPAARGV